MIEVAGDVPVLVRGGGRVDDRTLLERTAAVLAQGARGIVYGRNVVQHENPSGITRALMAVLHDKASVDDALRLVGKRSDQDRERGHRGRRSDGTGDRRGAAAMARADRSPGASAANRGLRHQSGSPGLVRPDTHCDADGDRLRRPPGDDAIDVLYIAVRHDLHRQLYVDTIQAGKSLLAEKPFGIDGSAAEAIMAAIAANPQSFVRCSSEMPFFPGAQRPSTTRVRRPGRIIEARCSFLHASDLDVGKPINWKRQARYCGEAGVMNDLGLHAWHVPLRLGWAPDRILACCRTS